MGRLTGRTAIVTGASRGLGRAIALAMGAEGAAVAVVARTEIDYLKPARLGDKLLVTAELIRLEKIRSFMRFEITSADKPELVFIRCVQTMVPVQLPGGRPQRVPQAWRDAYPQLLSEK